MLDYLIIGSGLYGCTFARLAKDAGYKVLILEKRNHPFGNCYTENINSINVHKYGPHIFHTSNNNIWNFVNQFTKFNNFINRPKVNYKNKIYSFPINLFTLHQLWGVTTPAEAIDKINKVKINISNPNNLEEYVLSKLGEEIYYTFIYGYTIKQWNTQPKNLPASIFKRLPIRFDFNDNYFNDIYQGIPVGGYSQMMHSMTSDIEIVLDTNYLFNRDYWNSLAKTVVYCGPVDEFFDYSLGKLSYRSLSFEHCLMNQIDYQGNAVVNYTDIEVPYTRLIEHKHFDFCDSEVTIVTKEFPAEYSETLEPYYPINNKINNQLYDSYKKIIPKKFIFGGRLAQYKYFDMHQVIGSAMNKFYSINEAQ